MRIHKTSRKFLMNEDEKVFTSVSVVPWVAKGKRYSISLLNQDTTSYSPSGHPVDDNQSKFLLISTRFACAAVACPVNLHKVTPINFIRARDISHKNCFVIQSSTDVTRTSACECAFPIKSNSTSLLTFFLGLLQFHSQPSVQALHSHGHHPLTNSSTPPRSRWLSWTTKVSEVIQNVGCGRFE